MITLSTPPGTGGRAVDLRGLSVYQGGQILNLSIKAAVSKRVSLLIGGARPPLAPALPHVQIWWALGPWFLILISAS